MRTISDFLARKGVASASFPSAASAKILPSRAEERSEPTFADIGARVGEDNETLRNLLIDTDRRIGALDEEKTENFGLRNALTELRATHESLHSEHGLLEKRAAELETAGEDLRRE